MDWEKEYKELTSANFAVLYPGMFDAETIEFAQHILQKHAGQHLLILLKERHAENTASASGLGEDGLRNAD